MVSMPPAETPLNQHSLQALEHWLQQLGAQRLDNDPCGWSWQQEGWTAEISLQQTDLAVIWSPNEAPRPCVFPYGLSRADVEAALRLGP